METTETTETAEQAVEQNQNVALILITYTAGVALVAVGGYKVGGYVQRKLAARRAVKAAREDIQTDGPLES